MSAPLLAAAGISKTYASGGRRVAALEDVSIAVAPGQTLGLVGPFRAFQFRRPGAR